MAPMRATDVLRMLLKGSFGMLEERASAARDDEWRGRALPGTSKPGFIIWHCARILDWTIHSAVQGVPEVADSERWRERFPREAAYGAGIPAELADQVADSTPARVVAEYLVEVRTPALAWFDLQDDRSLEAVPALQEHQALRPGYLDPSVWAEVADLNGLPAWQLLMRPAGAHIRRHMGEYDLLVEALRAGAATPRG